MVGSFLPDELIGWTRGSDGLETFLEGAFGIFFLRFGHDFFDGLTEVLENESAGGGETSVEIDRPGEGFEGVSEI